VSYSDFRARFAEVMDPEFYPIAYLDAAIADGRIIMMADGNSAICIEERVYPSGRKDVHGLVAVGDMQTITEMLIPRAEQWGLERGCSGAMIESREGWLKALRPFGYELHQVAIRKVL
jgi:hypothetical protein